MSDNLKLEWTPKGHNGSGIMTAILDDKPLYVDQGNLTREKFRSEFTKKLCAKYPAIQPSQVNEELTKMAAESVRNDSRNAKSEPMEGEFQIIRPERFILPAVSGLTCATTALIDGKPAGKWTLYMQWADGRRESIELPEYLTMPDNTRLWIHPNPSPPAADSMPGWSLRSRREWLNGKAGSEPAELFQRLSERTAYFIDLPADRAAGILSTLILWIVLSYCFPAWSAVPYLYIGGPLGSGKSRIFEILDRLTFRPINSSSMTGPALFRTLNDRSGTLLLDEAERLKSDTPENNELLSMLLTGYKRGGKAIRMEPLGDGTFKTIHYDVFGLKALACISGLPPALSSRCIPLIMFRAGPKSTKPRRRIDEDPASWQRLRDDLHIMALEHGPVWLELPGRSEVCPAMTGRDYELWQPLLSLARWLTDCGARGLYDLMVQYAQETIETGKDDQTPEADEILLRITAAKVQFGQMFTPGELLAQAQDEEPAIFSKWSGKGVANALRRYGLVTHKSHGRKVYRGLSVSDLLRIQTHYQIDLNLPVSEKAPDTSPDMCPTCPKYPEPIISGP